MTDDELAIWPLYPPDVAPPSIDHSPRARTDVGRSSPLPPPSSEPWPAPSNGGPPPGPPINSEPPLVSRRNAVTSRRAALTRAGAVMAGAGALGLGAAAVGRHLREPADLPRTLINVTDHGALGDGAADDT